MSCMLVIDMNPVLPGVWGFRRGLLEVKDMFRSILMHATLLWHTENTKKNAACVLLALPGFLVHVGWGSDDDQHRQHHIAIDCHCYPVSTGD